jgi:hypothetical protein
LPIAFGDGSDENRAATAASAKGKEALKDMEVADIPHAPMALNELPRVPMQFRNRIQD